MYFVSFLALHILCPSKHFENVFCGLLSSFAFSSFLESFKGQRMRFFVSLFLKCSATDLSSFNEILRCSLWVINCGYHFYFFGSKAQYIGHWSRSSRHEIALIAIKKPLWFTMESESFFSEKERKPSSWERISLTWQSTKNFHPLPALDEQVGPN